MILADTGAIYALIAKRDRNHLAASEWYEAMASREQLMITQPILTETWLLAAARLGAFYADRFWESVIGGVFGVIELDDRDLRLALEIERKYADAALGFVDSTSMAACERQKIEKVFTFDRAHFGAYRPKFTKYLELVPAG